MRTNAKTPRVKKKPIHIPEDLHTNIKVVAAMRNVSLEQIAEEAIRIGLPKLK